MSAPPSPSNSETSTVNFTLEALADEVLDAFGDHPPPTARASMEAWLQHLEAGGVMPSPQELIGLLSAFLKERALSPRPLTDDALAALGDVNAIGAVLIQDEPDYFHFPHFVDGEDWKQCKSKLTHIGVRLVSPAGDPVHGTAVQRGGLELMLELVNANTNETLQDPQLTGVAGGVFEQCAAARACRPRPRPHARSGSPLTARMLCRPQEGGSVGEPPCVSVQDLEPLTPDGQREAADSGEANRP